MSKVELVWATPNLEQVIGDSARVSAPENVGSDPSDLIAYLIKNKHWSPFEMVNLCFRVEPTRTIGRQLLRHSPRPQEFSGRYASFRKLGGLRKTRARRKHPTNRQWSVECGYGDPLIEKWDQCQDEFIALVDKWFDPLLEDGLAKELARNILPEGMTPTRMEFNGNLRDWLFFCDLRCGNGSQKEATTEADQIKKILWHKAPVTCAAFFGAAA